MKEAALRWQCRRGMRELDVLLASWMERHYPAASGSQKAAFEALLTLPDPELSGYLLGGGRVDDEVTAGVLAQIRDRTQT